MMIMGIGTFFFVAVWVLGTVVNNGAIVILIFQERRLRHREGK